ncbi:hypothetical protein EYF80_050382 [Liparis tanakae]|uniref:Uncharacterized protein n=1 Tax=Liparis tanakae TaxID=230148 RepID=A0A4Z2FE89_9TELE|nr:hypothetical protein EYF80_050382 [Liparis tanakae]
MELHPPAAKTTRLILLGASTGGGAEFFCWEVGVGNPAAPLTGRTAFWHDLQRTLRRLEEAWRDAD